MGQSQTLNIQPRSRSPLVHLAGIRKSFDGKTVIDNLNLTINNGEFLTLLGPSGCGKTTVLRLIAGLENVDSGRIHLEDHDITHVPAENRHVNTVFQSYALFPHMTVADNIGYGLKLKKVPKAEIRKRVAEMLELVQLPGYEKRKPSELSGGQRQALTLLMATLQKPKLLLLDEHTAALDPKTAAKVLEITDMIVNRDHLTTLMITHNMKDAIAHGNRLIMMMEGKIILDIQGEEKKKLTVKDLLDQFERASGEEFSNDSALLG